MSIFQWDYSFFLNWTLSAHFDSLILINLEPEDVNLWYFKLCLKSLGYPCLKIWALNISLQPVPIVLYLLFMYNSWFILGIIIYSFVIIGDENSNKCGDYAPAFRKYQGKTFIIHMRVKHNIRTVEPFINFVNDLESFTL